MALVLELTIELRHVADVPDEGEQSDQGSEGGEELSEGDAFNSDIQEHDSDAQAEGIQRGGIGQATRKRHLRGSELILEDPLINPGVPTEEEFQKSDEADGCGKKSREIGRGATECWKGLLDF